MQWVVDTCVLIDVLENDSKFGMSSALTLNHFQQEGLVVSPVTMIELSPAFDGNFLEQKRFLGLCGVQHNELLSSADVKCAHAVWGKYVTEKRHGKVGKRPIADIMIGAFSLRFAGLITRNGVDFERWFPTLAIADPVIRH